MRIAIFILCLGSHVFVDETHFTSSQKVRVSFTFWHGRLDKSATPCVLLASAFVSGQPDLEDFWRLPCIKVLRPSVAGEWHQHPFFSHASYQMCWRQNTAVTAVLDVVCIASWRETSGHGFSLWTSCVAPLQALVGSRARSHGSHTATLRCWALVKCGRYMLCRETLEVVWEEHWHDAKFLVRATGAWVCNLCLAHSQLRLQ